MDEKIVELKSITQNLIKIIEPYQGNIKYQYSALKQLLAYLNSSDINPSNFEQAKYFFKTKLFLSHGGLSDFYIWKDDEHERISVNKPISLLVDKLWLLLDT